LSVRPDYVEALGNRGNTLMEARAAQCGLRGLRGGCQICGPDWPQAWNNLGAVLVQLNRYEDALDKFRQSSRNPSRLSRRAALARQRFVKLRNYTAALAAADTALSFQPE
jgi:tetratricopeptide (TPR) repeat protein